MKEFNDHVAGRRENSIPNFRSSRGLLSFQKSFVYTEDGYERKEEQRKLEYQKRAAMVLDKSNPYSSRVMQRGFFDPLNKTFGDSKDFPKKYVLKPEPPKYGPFKIGNLSKSGHEKTIGPMPYYIEDP